MNRRKRIPFARKVSYAMSWIRHPAFLLLLIAFFGVFTLSLGLAFPCGRYSSPVHGHCSNGNDFRSPLSFFWIGAGIALIASLFLIFQERNEGKWSNRQLFKQLIGTAGKRPIWRKRWYPFAFLIVYCPLAILILLQDRDAGLYWYHYFGQFFLLLPMLASVPASWLLTKARGLTGKKRN